MNTTTYAVDTAKNVMQLHWVEADTGVIHRRKLPRTKLIDFFAQIKPARIAMEACGGSHHWARSLAVFGHQVELLPAGQVRPFVIGNKDDAADARAIWLAAGHSDIRRVQVKSREQQAILSLHRFRAHWMSIRTSTINSMRGLLYEFGVVLPQGRNAALKGISERRSEIDVALPELMIRLLNEMLRTLREIGHNLEVVDEEIAAIQKSVAAAKVLREIPGFGVLGATACAAALGNGSSWRNARSFAATLGLCPSHRGTGGKTKMGSISKRGDPYLRTLLISGARSVVSKQSAPEWVKQMLLRRPVNVVVVALANKMARTAWALIARTRSFSPDWQSQPPMRSSTSAQCT